MVITTIDTSIIIILYYHPPLHIVKISINNRKWTTTRKKN